MKILVKSLSLLLILLCGFSMSSCNPEDTEEIKDNLDKLLIVGTWKHDKLEYYLTEYGDPQEVKTLDLSEYNIVSKFKADGTFAMSLLEVNPDGMILDTDNIMEGTWSYTNGVVTLSSYTEDSYDVIKLDEKNLVLQIIQTEQEGEVEKKYIQYLTRLSELFKEDYDSEDNNDSEGTTTPETGTYEYVDLGLSVKWATCNVGATKPEESGYYFAWGEIAEKEEYSWTTYKWCNGTNNSLTKYCTSGKFVSYGTVDNKTELEASDDAAQVYWGGKWRTPTIDEVSELTKAYNCTWTWTTQNGVNGFIVTSKKNGNSIFLPAAGYRYNDNITGVGERGDYWACTINKEMPSYAQGFGFGLNQYTNNPFYDLCLTGSRYYGNNIRAVCD